MPEDAKQELAAYRLQKACDRLEEAKTLLAAEQFAGVANRSYYAIFHGIRAVLATEGVDFKKHSAIISHFRQYYIKPGTFLPEYSDMINDAFTVRQMSDYNDFYVVSKADAAEQLQEAEGFLDAVKVYLDAK